MQGDAAAPGPFPDQDQGIADRLRQIEVRQLQLHPPGFDLRQVEDVVDEGEQVLPGLEDVAQVFRLLLVDLAEHPLGQHLGEADDGVQRRAQLVRHVGQELRLVLAGDLQLATLVGDLPEETSVLDGQGRLGGKGLEQLDDLRRKLARRLPVDGEPADELVFAQHRDGQHGPGARAEQDVAERAAIGIL